MDGPCGVTVRSAEQRDLDEVYLIEIDSFDAPYPRWYFDILYALSNYGETFLVSLDKHNRLDGYIVALERRGGICHIVSVVVRRDCRRQHVGSVLLQSLFEVCESKKPNMYLLEVDMDNIAAQVLYGRHGFGYSGVIPNYYGVGRHALIMARIKV